MLGSAVEQRPAWTWLDKSKLCFGVIAVESRCELDDSKEESCMCLIAAELKELWKQMDTKEELNIKETYKN